MDSFGNDAFFGLAHIFNSHIVVVSTTGSYTINQYVGNVAPYSFVPHILTSFSDKMTFVQRIGNIIVSIISDLYYKFLIAPAQKQIYDEMCPNCPPFEKTIKNVSFALINTHAIFESPRPYLPNMVAIGGVHIKNPKLLPTNLKTELDNAKDGVILFSLGSNLNSHDLPEHTIEDILKTFAKFPQKVLWKFEDETLKKKLPKNVQISDWYPQSDILAHPNVKLFITHGGQLSCTEAVYRGVPIIGVPIYADQYANIAQLVSSGFGQQILLEELTEESFTNKIKEVLENKSYSETIKRSSEILKDNPQTPLDRAVFWVEHVIRTNGAKHLRSASVDLSMPVYLLLDVLACAGTVAPSILAGIYILIRSLCCRKQQKEEGKKKKSKKE